MTCCEHTHRRPRRYQAGVAEAVLVLSERDTHTISQYDDRCGQVGNLSCCCLLPIACQRVLLCTRVLMLSLRKSIDGQDLEKLSLHA